MVYESPKQVNPFVTDKLGTGKTDTVTTPVSLHPFIAQPVTVYDVVTDGVTLEKPPVIAQPPHPVTGPEEALIGKTSPAQILPLGETVIVGD
jgi:hypothetical protein